MPYTFGYPDRFSLIFFGLKVKIKVYSKTTYSLLPYREDIEPIITEVVFENKALRKILDPKRDEVT